MDGKAEGIATILRCKDDFADENIVVGSRAGGTTSDVQALDSATVFCDKKGGVKVHRRKRESTEALNVSFAKLLAEFAEKFAQLGADAPLSPAGVLVSDDGGGDKVYRYSVLTTPLIPIEQARNTTVAKAFLAACKPVGF